MVYTDETPKLLRKMKPGVRVEHYKHGPGTVTGPPQYSQVPVEFDNPRESNLTGNLYCYPDNLDILPQDPVS